eukprot:gene7420-15160_t
MYDRDPVAVLEQDSDCESGSGTGVGFFHCVAYEHTKDILYIIGLSGQGADVASIWFRNLLRFLDHHHPEGSDGNRCCHGDTFVSGDNTNESKLLATSTSISPPAGAIGISNDYSDHTEYEIIGDGSEGDLVVDINPEHMTFPTKLEDFRGIRVDAIDHRGQWFT